MSPHFLKLQTILEAHLGVDKEQVVPASHLDDDLGADSLDRVQITMAIEEVFGIDVRDNEEDGWRTVQDILDYLDRSA